MHTKVNVPSLHASEVDHFERPSLPAIRGPLEHLRPILIAGFGFCALLSVAFYNGYPTLFPDSGSYLLTGAYFKALPPFRAPGYSVFTRLASLGVTAWYAVAAQALIVVYILFEACDYLTAASRKDRDWLLLASLCALTVFSSLPWLAGQLMPDIFAGVLFVSAYLLAFSAELSLLRRILVALIMMTSTASHMSLLPIASLFVAAPAVQWILSGGRSGNWNKRAALLWLVVPIVAASFATATLNRSMGLGFRVSPSGKTFLLARLFGDHLATEFLEANCPRHSFISCQYLSNLPRSQDEFLFKHPIARALDEHEDEVAEIARGAILAHPFRFVESSAWETLLQLVHFRTGDEIRSYSASDWNDEAIQQVFPNDLEAFRESRQSRGLLLPLADFAAAAHTPFFWFSLAACLPLARTDRFPRINRFFAAALAFLALNAAVCATFSGVYERYQCRVAWVVPFCFTAYAYSFLKEWKAGDAAERMERQFGWQATSTPAVLAEARNPQPEQNAALDIELDPS